jgi:ABC-2 type transport system permease protein
MMFGHVLEDHVKVYGHGRLHGLPRAGPGDDERAAERIRQQFVLAHPEQDHGQPGVRAAHAAVALGLVRWPMSARRSSAALAVGLGVFVVTIWFTDAPAFVAPLWIVVFALLGAAMLGVLGLIAGLWAEKFDQMAVFQNFVIMPHHLSERRFLLHPGSLPPFWQTVSHLNPIFYMIDGFRYGFFGVSDASPWLSLSIVGSAACRERRGRPSPAHRLQNQKLRSPFNPHDRRRTAGRLSQRTCPANTSRSRATADIGTPPSSRPNSKANARFSATSGSTPPSVRKCIPTKCMRCR